MKPRWPVVAVYHVFTCCYLCIFGMCWGVHRGIDPMAAAHHDEFVERQLLTHSVSEDKECDIVTDDMLCVTSD